MIQPLSVFLFSLLAMLRSYREGGPAERRQGESIMRLVLYILNPVK